MQMQLIDKFKIEGFQDFQQYLKINPINIQITYAETQNKLLFYVNRYKYRFIANSLLFSSSIQKDTNVIFITKNGLNKAKEILINEKLFQGIGVIYTSKYPLAARHFALEFETTDLHNLLNFEYFLLDEEGK